MAETKGSRLLRAWCVKYGVSTTDLAKRVQKAMKDLDGIRKPKHPAYSAARLWVSGKWVPQIHTRKAIEEATDAYVKLADWLEVCE